jgi:hypothetical protein
MTTITIVLTDLPRGRGVTVQTDGSPPSVGGFATPAEALSADLLRTCEARAIDVQYGNASTWLAGELLAAQVAA